MQGVDSYVHDRNKNQAWSRMAKKDQAKNGGIAQLGER